MLRGNCWGTGEDFVAAIGSSSCGDTSEGDFGKKVGIGTAIRLIPKNRSVNKPVKMHFYHFSGSPFSFVIYCPTD